MRKIRGLDCWLDVLSAATRQDVERHLKSQCLQDGESVYSIGDPGRSCYFIQRGGVRILDYSSSGRALQMMNLRAGASFGETSLIDGLPRSDNAYSVGETELCVLDRGAFEQLSARHREIADGLNLHLSYRLRLASSAVKDASVLTLRDRLPRLLALLAYSHGRREPPDAIRIEGVSHQELADMLGSTRQGVSRELKALERAHLVELRYREILLPDPEALTERFASLIGEEPLIPDTS